MTHGGLGGRKNARRHLPKGHGCFFHNTLRYCFPLVTYPSVILIVSEEVHQKLSITTLSQNRLVLFLDRLLTQLHREHGLHWTLSAQCAPPSSVSNANSRGTFRPLQRLMMTVSGAVVDRGTCLITLPLLVPSSFPIFFFPLLEPPFPGIQPTNPQSVWGSPNVHRRADFQA
jgi:hypothetical protein